METKAKLVSRINAIIKYRKITQKKAGEVLGINQSTVSGLVRGRLSEFSVDCLLGLLNKLDGDIEIVIKPKHTTMPETITVNFAEQIALS